MPLAFEAATRTGDLRRDRAFRLECGASRTFQPFNFTWVERSRECPSYTPFGPFPEPFGPTLVQGRHRKATAVPFLTVGEVAVRLRVTAATVYSLCASGKLQHVRISNSLRIALEDVEPFVRRKRSTVTP